MKLLQLGLFDWLMPEQPDVARPKPSPVALVHVTDWIAHPQANRSIDCQGQRLHFLLKRGKRKTIGLQISSDGLVVSAPRWALVSDIVQVVNERAPWAMEKMREVRRRDEAHLRQSIDWADGVSIPYLGEMIRVRLDSATFSEDLAEEQNAPLRVLRISLAPNATPTQIREKVQAWLVKQARELFAQRLDEYAPKLGVQWKRLRLSQARTRWGSANAQGTICLNWRLIHHALPVIDYVVVHELSHLREMNHSPAFWDTVASVMPDYKHNMGVLKKEALPPW